MIPPQTTVKETWLPWQHFVECLPENVATGQHDCCSWLSSETNSNLLQGETPPEHTKNTKMPELAKGRRRRKEETFGVHVLVGEVKGVKVKKKTKVCLGVIE